MRTDMLMVYHGGNLLSVLKIMILSVCLSLFCSGCTDVNFYSIPDRST